MQEAEWNVNLSLSVSPWRIHIHSSAISGDCLFHILAVRAGLNPGYQPLAFLIYGGRTVLTDRCRWFLWCFVVLLTKIFQKHHFFVRAVANIGHVISVKKSQYREC